MSGSLDGLGQPADFAEIESLVPEATLGDNGGVRRRRRSLRITGLWQIGGRSDLTWEDAVRLDLDYVENWSLSLDLTILARTVLTVARGGGAY